jgi:glycosyltransferase involved in cell wall biosynthesis
MHIGEGIMNKVLHIINGEFFAGAERVQDLLALRLPDFGYECGFVCLKDGVFAKHRKSSVPLEVMAMRSRVDFAIVSRIATFAKSGGYQIIHTHTLRSALIGRLVASKLQLPLVHHVHSPTQRDTESTLRNMANAFIEDKLVLPSATHLVAVSSSLKGYLLDRGVSSARITVVPNGVPVVRSEPAWHAPVDEWVIGTVALFRPRKGIEVLLKSLRELLDQGLNVRLKAVGIFETSDYEESIVDLVKELGLVNKVQWTGFSNDVPREMESMHIFVLPSLFGEGLPMVVIEAMSVGIPVVASRVEGIPEVINTPEVGVVVEPNDVSSLTNGLKALISGDLSAQAIADAAHIRQMKHYSDVSMASAVVVAYKNAKKLKI